MFIGLSTVNLIRYLQILFYKQCTERSWFSPMAYMGINAVVIMQCVQRQPGCEPPSSVSSTNSLFLTQSSCWGAPAHSFPRSFVASGAQIWAFKRELEQLSGTILTMGSLWSSHVSCSSRLLRLSHSCRGEKSPSSGISGDAAAVSLCWDGDRYDNWSKISRGHSLNISRFHLDHFCCCSSAVSRQSYSYSHCCSHYWARGAPIKNSPTKTDKHRCLFGVCHGSLSLFGTVRRFLARFDNVKSVFVCVWYTKKSHRDLRESFQKFKGAINNI